MIDLDTRLLKLWTHLAEDAFTDSIADYGRSLTYNIKDTTSARSLATGLAVKAFQQQAEHIKGGGFINMGHEKLSSFHLKLPENDISALAKLIRDLHRHGNIAIQQAGKLIFGIDARSYERGSGLKGRSNRTMDLNSSDLVIHIPCARGKNTLAISRLKLPIADLAKHLQGEALQKLRDFISEAGVEIPTIAKWQTLFAGTKGLA